MEERSEEKLRKDTREILKDSTPERANLIPILQKVQKKHEYLSSAAISEVSNFLDISENNIYGVATFYAQFRFNKPGKHTIRVCEGTACHVRGGKAVMEALQQQLGITVRETTDDMMFSIESARCFGCCGLAPVVTVDDNVHGQLRKSDVSKIIEHYREN